jgi:hypothetical protein
MRKGAKAKTASAAKRRKKTAHGVSRGFHQANNKAPEGAKEIARW